MVLPSAPGGAERPLVSIVIPSYNQGRFIRETLDSVFAQEYQPMEVLVVDGASTDETLDVLRSFVQRPELRWWSEPDRGVVEAVNKGLSRASGIFASIQSSDDTYLPGAIATAIPQLLSADRPALVFGDVMQVDAQGVEVSRTSLPDFSLEAFLSAQTWIPQPSAFFDLDLALRLGGWREEVPYAADTDLWLRIAFRAGVRKIPGLLAKRRIHEAQRDKQGRNVIRDYCRMLDTSPDLQRAPRRLRRAAAAGKLIRANRYDYGAPSWKRFARLLGASLIFPPVLRHVGLWAVLPFGFAIRSTAVRVARGLGLA